MRKIICISTGCFYSRINRKGYLLIKDMNKVIELCSKLDIDGIELLWGNAADLMKFKINKKSVKILKKYKFNTIHLPFKLNKNEKLKIYKNKKIINILKKIYRLYDIIGAKGINIHPHQIKNFRILDTKNYQHTIENMEMEHNYSIAYYNNILKKNPSSKFVFDTTHAGESKETKKLFNAFKKKILYLHLSANYFNHLHLPLHSLSKEYLKPLEFIKKAKFPIVLENQIGTKTIDEYKKEINFARKWLK